MKRCAILLLVLFSFCKLSQAQNPGDTIKVKTFHYGSNSRDTVAYFPTANLSYERIIMAYNMRCKNGLVSNGTDRNLGCGEWDYSCNTYIVDSSKVEEVSASQPKYVITNFTGPTFNYTTKPVYDYIQYTQKRVTIDSVLYDSSFAIGQSKLTGNTVIATHQHSGKSQFIYKATELLAAGLSAGPIHSLQLEVLNNGAKASFLKVKIKHTFKNDFSVIATEQGNYTEVYFSNHQFGSGLNRLNFHTPFVWNGTNNIVVEFSFTNSLKDSLLLLASSATDAISGITALNNYSLDLSHNGHVKLDTADFSKVKNEISISFWAFGNASQMPISTSILYGYDNNINNRQLNIHLPFSNANVYFDCGFVGGYDRIEKAASSAEMGGRWNHWVFVKNAATGTMKVFLNGSLWMSGTAKTKAINLMNLILGKDQNLNNNYKGRISELLIWSKALPDSQIGNITAGISGYMVPFAGDIVAYYPMGEASGQSITEVIHNKTAAGTNLRWSYERGEQILFGFSQVDLRPNLIFSRASQTSTTQNILVRDSILRKTNVVEEYSITSKQGQFPISNDQINLVSTQSNWFNANHSYVYNGDSSSLPMIDSVAVNAEGSLALSNLTFFRRFPWYNEIMSFVTPYGIGLNLGATGKTWYFDVTDFTPILKGNKRILMTLGGQNQEQNDVEFWFIVGTPPKNVLEFNQIWQGTNRTGQAPLTAINNNTRFAPLKVPTLAAGKEFKIRSTITGHGAEGEFEANGGQVTHQLNLNGGANEYDWFISEECAFNPVFPQGGTWVYDRQGWCPGQKSLTKEFKVNGHVTAGDSLLVDYNASNPPNPSGSYNYHVAHQLVTYGDFNFKKDIRLIDVLNPNNAILFGRQNPICSTPKIIVQNGGSEKITGLVINYGVNNGTRQTFTWKGSIEPLAFDTITLPTYDVLWNSGIAGNTNNTFSVKIGSVNGTGGDENLLNNEIASKFNLPEIAPSVFTLEFRTNNNPSENNYKLFDDYGNLVDAQSFTQANFTFSKGYNLGGCFKLVIEDKGNDGVQWWANPNQGTGFIRLKRANGQIFKTFQPDFGGGFEYSFTTNWALNTAEKTKMAEWVVYPNPAKDKITIVGQHLNGARLSVLNLLGQTCLQETVDAEESYTLKNQGLTPGVYLVKISKENEISTQKLIVE